eukprot:CAMPEP_0177658638 /NCGR_PEP_ID=MMETSP0447-20121125/16935_1 /TAXON_ID=0 /ORGANISM="Stygamoeba regulata, Strain BSH-02190019" /LENGTH=351 /DNA_ID=CAMNT_0019163293 /DNA_START=103 /DNA_END=1158 /DNA_ORIENTATION=+
MGNLCNGGVAESPESQVIDRKLREDRRALTSQIHLLLLGAGDSGKSTIANQFRLINNRPFTADELEQFKIAVQINAVDYMRRLLLANHRSNIGITPENEQIAVNFLNIKMMDVKVNKEIADMIETLWKDQGVQHTYKLNGDALLSDSAVFFLDNIHRICAPDYMPTEEDCLRCRRRTTAIVETIFHLKNSTFKLIDVGGQRSERRKWINCFEGVTSLLFCASLSDYDMVLEEAHETNRMLESLLLFKELMNLDPFANKPVILFLNKKDLFDKKILHVDPSIIFPKYTSGCNGEAALEYIKNAYLSAVKESDKQHAIYVHITVALERENIRFVWNAIVDNVIRSRMEGIGIY